MRGRGFHLWFALAALALANPARAAKEPVRLAPSSKWEVNYAADSCRLARRFGTGEWLSVLIMDRFQPSESFRLTITGRPLKKALAGRDAKFRFGPAEGEQQLPFLEGETGGVPSLIFPGALRIAPPTESEQATLKRLNRTGGFDPFEPAPIGVDREQAANFLSVEVAGLPEMVFETGSLGPPFAALRKCMDNLLTHWGIDVARHASLSREAKPTKSPAAWFHYTDYPVSMVRQGMQGIIHFRVSVDAEGEVSDCHIQQSTRPAEFDETVCNVLKKRARFEPALDAGGNPIASYFVSQVRFVMPQ